MVPNPVPVYILNTDHHLALCAMQLVRADSLNQGLSIVTRNAMFEIELSSSFPKYKFLKILKNIEIQISYKISINECSSNLKSE